ncbi:MAG: hypothetical protein INR72_19955 [Williamsia herbipolensis]|nr:hypothetical protein [Williamsia herbipolensis]
MARLRKAVMVTALLGAGLASQAGAAFASDGHDHGHRDHHRGDSQSGLVNADDTQTVVPTDVCGNDVPVNALGVQVPLQDIAGDIPLLSPSDDDGGNAAGVQKNCGSDVDTDR